MNSSARRSPAAIAAPAAFILAALWLASPFDTPYYGLSRAMHASTVIHIVAPVCAALAALEGGRLRTSGTLSRPAVRSRWAITMRALAPTLALGIAVIGSAFALAVAQGSPLSTTTASTFGVSLVVLGAHTMCGLAAGLWLPIGVSLPVALATSWSWIMLPVTLEPLWVRHLTGYFGNCCTIETVPSWRPLAASFVVASAAIAAATALLWSGASRFRLPIVGAVLVSGLAAGATLVHGMGPSAGTARHREDLVCREANPTVCVWPEHLGAQARVHAEAVALTQRANASGMKLEGTVSEAPDARWRVSVVPGQSRSDLRATLVFGLLPPYPTCSIETTSRPAEPYPADAVRPVLQSWLAQTFDISTASYSPQSPDEQRELRAVQRSPAAAQVAWFRENSAALAECRRAPSLLTAGAKR